MSKKSVVCRSKNKCVLHVGAREAGCIKMGPKIDEVWVLKSMIFVIFVDRFFVDFMFNFVSWPGRPDKRRAHTEHTQSTHRGNQTGKSRSGCVRCMGTRRRILRIHIRTNMRTQSHEDSHEDAHDDSHEDSHEGSHEYRQWGQAVHKNHQQSQVSLAFCSLLGGVGCEIINTKNLNSFSH